MYNVADWDNEMAKDMLPLDQEMEAFGEEMPKPKFTEQDCKEAAAGKYCDT